MNEEFETIEEIDEETERFITKVQIAYTAILALLLKQIDGNNSKRELKKLENEIKLITDNLNVEAKVFSKDVFPEYYLLSLRNMDNLTVKMSGVKKLSGAKHSIHKEALKRATNDLYRDLAKNTQYMSREAKKVIRNNAQELLTAMIEGGESYITVKKKLKDQLKAQGVSSFKDAGRKNWTIDRYADMVVRTKSRIVHNEGTINRLSEYQERYSEDGEYVEDFDLIQISNHGASDWCSYYEDMVFSISGKSENYPSIDTLPNRPYNTLHPNCKHHFLAYIPTLKGKGETVSKKYQSLSMSELNKMDYQARKRK